MRLTADLLLETNASDSVPCILMLHPQSGDEQVIERNELKTSLPCPQREYMDVYGNLCLRTMIPAGPFRLENKIVAVCADEIEVDPAAAFTLMQDLPDNVLQFTLPSRYCESDLLGEKAREIIGLPEAAGSVPTIGYATGYKQVESIRSWIHENFEYAYGSSDSSTSARDVLTSRKGVCRDYAHAGIALCRSLDIPARMVVGYLYGLKPMDMHAWFQAYLGGRWFTFDATQKDPKGNRIVIAYGKDAADVAIATYFTNIELTRFEVTVSIAD
ncbi:MAG TPA: transglutaminase family protein [Puia sp.]|nr:transglutaminase family protein [Puia sp.]